MGKSGLSPQSSNLPTMLRALRDAANALHNAELLTSEAVSEGLVLCDEIAYLLQNQQLAQGSPTRARAQTLPTPMTPQGAAQGAAHQAAELRRTMSQSSAGEPSVIATTSLSSPTTDSILLLPPELLARVVSKLAATEDIGRLDCTCLGFHGLPPPPPPPPPPPLPRPPSVIEEGLRLRTGRLRGTAAAQQLGGELSWVQKLCWEERKQRVTNLRSVGTGGMGWDRIG